VTPSTAGAPLYPDYSTLSRDELAAFVLEVVDTLDALGVEPGALPLRLAYLRGASAGLRPMAPGKRARKAAAAEVRVARQHDPSWAGARRSFFAALGGLGISDRYELVAAFCESRKLPRPSQMTEEQRAAFLAKMADEERRAAYHTWVGANGDAVAAELAGAAAEDAAGGAVEADAAEAAA
jgi:hypothetical protein